MKPLRAPVVQTPGASLRACEWKPLRLLLFPISILSFCCLPAQAAVLYSDLGPAGDLYDSGTFWNVCGSTSGAPACSSGSSEIASEFTVGGTGSLVVTEIDLGLVNITGIPGTDTVFVEILSNNNNTPGTGIANAMWDETALPSSDFGMCCDLVSITGITNVTLTGGQTYFMEVGPVSGTDDSWNGWYYNSTSTTGVVVTSTDAALTPPAFDVLGGSSTPEPGSFVLLASGLIAMLSAACRRRSC